MSTSFRRRAANSLAALAITLGAPACALARDSGAPSPGSGPETEVQVRFDAVRKVILQTMEEANVPSIAVAVVKDGEILWEEGFGWADRERRIPATAQTPYSLASMTKPITATAVMRLRETGQLDIDAPIERYLGGARLTAHAGSADQVTARRIMSHSAGLPQYGNFYLDGSEPAGAAETISKFGIVVFPPDSRFEYSNIGMRILDAAIAEVSGVTYASYLQREVFAPLGMTHSAVGMPSSTEAAIRYDSDRNPMRFYMTDHPGSGDVWASAHDTARFLAFHMGDPLPDQAPILSEATRLEMQRPAGDHPMPTPPDEPRRDIGANWILSEANGHPQVWHSGGQPGVSAFMAFYPDQDLGIVLLANSSAPLGRVGHAIREAIAPELLVPETEQAAPSPQPLPFRGEWAGTATSYVGAQPLTLSFQDSGQVAVRFGDQEATRLLQPAFENGALTGRFSGVSNIPEAGKTSHNLSLKVMLVDGELVGQLVAQGMSDDTAFMLPSFVRLHPRRARPLMPEGSPLAGRIFDAEGVPMTPAMAYGKAGRKYRYYVSQPLQVGRGAALDREIVRRVASGPIEGMVMEQLAACGLIAPDAGGAAIRAAWSG